MDGRDPLELRVLGTLTSGVESAGTVAERLGLAREDVALVLDRAVLDGLATRLDLAGTAAYSLSPQGREVVGPEVDDRAGPSSDPVVAESLPDPVPEPVLDPSPTAPAEVAVVPDVADVPAATAVTAPVESAAPTSTPKAVNARHVVYAAIYVLFGLFLLLLQPVVGVLLLVAGLALGGYTLRPLLRGSGSRDGTGGGVSPR